MKVTIYGPNLPSQDETFHVHAAGCADTKRGIYRHIRAGGDQGGWDIEVTSVRQIVEDVYSDQMAENDDEWATWQPYASDFKVFPCVDLPDEAEAADQDAKNELAAAHIHRAIDELESAWKLLPNEGIGADVRKALSVLAGLDGMKAGQS